MHPSQELVPHLLIKPPHRIGICIRSTDIVSCGEEMACVKADSDAGYILDKGDYGGEIVEYGADKVGVGVGL